MANEPTGRPAKGYTIMRSMIDYVMASLYVGLGIFLVFPEKLGFEMESFDKTFRILFGSICIIYGLFRFYRGIRKKY